MAHLTGGKRIRESLGGWVDPAGPAKDALEVAIETAMVDYWQGQLQRIQVELTPKVPEDRKAIQLSLGFWRDEAKRLLKILLPHIQMGAEGGVTVHQAAVAEMSIGVDWTLPFTEAADWARKYCGELVTKVTDTTRRRIGTQVANWIETEHTLPDLWKQLAEDHAFSRSRAKLIGTTEATRAYAEGELTAARQLEKESVFEYIKMWESIPDDNRCEICENLQAATVKGIKTPFQSMVGPLQGPPAHPGCRCAVTTRPMVPGVG